MQRTRSIVVVGAGYAGVRAANRIAAAGVRGATVTMVNPRSEFVERIRLHQHAAGSGSATQPLRELLHPAVRLRLASVELIDDGLVTLDDGDTLGFDYLVYAVGSTAAAVPNTHVVGVFEGAERLRSALRALGSGDRVVISGAGPTGIETAAEIAEQYPELVVELVSDTVAAALPPRSRVKVHALLSRLGVSVRTGVRVTATHPDHVELSDGTRLPSACTVTTTGFTVPRLARDSGLPVDDLGRLRTDARLVCPADPRIVGVGDAVAPEGGALRMSCQAAIPMGTHGADAVVAMLTGREPRAHAARFVGQAMSLGRRVGVIQPSRRDDTPAGALITGRIAGMLKEFVCRSTVRQISAGAGARTQTPVEGVHV